MALYYSVKPKQVFIAANETFFPGRGEYLVSADVYNGKIADGQTDFKDVCEQPVNQVSVD